MYNFETQKNMLSATLSLLAENNIEKISALGGGTALASCNHSAPQNFPLLSS